MALLDWGPEYACGIAEIDKEHKRFFEYINDLQISMMAGQGQDELRTILENLAQYTKEHFAHEELQMREVGYPDYFKHKAEHERILQKLQGFMERFGNAEQGLAMEVLDFLKEWAEEHVRVLDVEYAQHYLANTPK